MVRFVAFADPNRRVAIQVARWNKDALKGDWIVYLRSWRRTYAVLIAVPRILRRLRAAMRAFKEAD